MPLPSLSGASCPDAAAEPVLDPSAKFVLQNGHEQSITRISVSADGKTLVSAGMEGTIRVWDLNAGIILRKFGTAGFFIVNMSLTADGKRLAYYAPDGTPEGLAIRIVDLDRPSSIRTITPYYGTFQLSSDGKRLAIAVDKLMLFDVDTGKQLLELPLGTKTPMVLDVQWDEADARIALAAPGEVVIVDANKGAITHRLNAKYSSLSDTPASILFAKDRVLVRSTVGAITRYDLASTTPPTTLPGEYREMAITKDRLWVSDLRTKQVSAFSFPNLTPVKLPATSLPLTDCMATSRDQRMIVFAGNDFLHSTRIDARDAETLRPLRTIEGRNSNVEALAIDRTGKSLITKSFIGEIYKWNLDDGSRALPMAGREPSRTGLVELDYAPDGKTFVETTHSWEIQIHDADTGRTLHAWHPEDGHFLTFARFIPNTSDLITVAWENYYREPLPEKRPQPAPRTSPPKVTPPKVSPTKPGPRKPAVPKVAPPKPAPPKVAPPTIPPKQVIAKPNPHVVIDRWDLSGSAAPATPAKPGKPWKPPGKRIAEVRHEAHEVAMSPQGDRMALEGETEITMIRLDTGAVTWTSPLLVMDPSDPKQREGQFDPGSRWLAFSPDGKSLLLSARRLEKNSQGGLTFVSRLFVYDVATGRITATHRVNTFGPVVWHHDKVLIGGLRPVVLQAPAMTERGRIEALDNSIKAVAVHPTRDLFIIGGDGGAVSFVNGNGTLTASLVSTGNGEWISTASDGTYRSSLDGARALAWSFAGPLEGFSFERFAARFDNPKGLGERLLGDLTQSTLALSRPPQLTFKEDVRHIIETPERYLPVTMNVTSANRVDRVRAFVDGRPLAEQLVCERQGQAKLMIPLHTGQNRVALVAYDASGQSSNAQNLDVISTSVETERPNLHVVAIGVSQYPNMTPEQQLDFADDDARSVAEAFQHQVGPGKPFAKMFTTLLLDEKVTVNSIENALSDLRSVGPNDLVAVFFAGHGARLGEGEMVFMTHQAKFTRESAQAHGLGWKKIQTSLSQVRGRVLMMLDACHSGHLTTEIVAPNEDLARQLAAGDRAGVFVFSAARGSQFSYEVPPVGQTGASRGLELAWGDQKPPPMNRELAGGHGLFTSALLEALTGDAPDRDRSGATEVGELVDYVTERVRSASNGKQTPWVARREMFGEFFVVPAKK